MITCSKAFCYLGYLLLYIFLLPIPLLLLVLTMFFFLQYARIRCVQGIGLNNQRNLLSNQELGGLICDLSLCSYHLLFRLGLVT